MTINWRKSSFSGGGEEAECIELGTSQAGFHIRESDAPGTVLSPAPAALGALLRAVKAGEFDPAARAAHD
ncbi:DUF397 domain-containing protein [Streptomyces zingiberis]|uniref:DUF397 domain-containing protein n=1 Tax=Streptomyces zingiberis TaxID=2053010 RepID=A0ABX1BSF7_9ACTN|nr:DUF397 domain-containing protein [Streptomyces zingiberis]NJQ00646.1 DUF397 domain-containing protein [Streptomyces zingiberis]